MKREINMRSDRNQANQLIENSLKEYKKSIGEVILGIKQVWLDYLVPQAEYLYTLNRFFAWYYFKAKKPDAYIKSMATRHLNKMFA